MNFILNQMTSKVPKCARPWRLILNEGLLTDRNVPDVTSDRWVDKVRTSPSRCDNTLSQISSSALSSNSPGGKFYYPYFALEKTEAWRGQMI